MLLSALAHAGLSEPEISQTISDLQNITRSRILLSATTPQAQELIQRITNDNPALDVEVLIVPEGSVANQTIWQSLSQKGLSCAILIEPEDTEPEDTEPEDNSQWLFMPFGNCSTPAQGPITHHTPDQTADPDTAEPDTAEPDTASSSVNVSPAFLTDADVLARVRVVQAGAGARLLLGAVGPEVEKMLNRMLQSNPDLDVAVVRLPTAGDPVREVWEALNTAGLGCALRISADGEGWQASPFGSCSAADVSASTSPASGTDSAEAVVRVELPPEDLTATYLARRVELVPVGPQEPSLWTIQDRSGATMSAPAFASLMGDTAGTTQLLAEQQRSMKLTRWLYIGGTVLATSAIVPRINRPEDGSAAEDRLWSSAFLLSTGLTTVLVARRAIDAVNDQQSNPSNYYSQEEAQGLVDNYNQNLQQSLGLAPSGEPPMPEQNRPPSETDSSDGTDSSDETGSEGVLEEGEQP